MPTPSRPAPAAVRIRGGQPHFVDYLIGLASLAGFTAERTDLREPLDSQYPAIDVLDGDPRAAPSSSGVTASSLGRVEVHAGGARAVFELPRQDEELIALLTGATAPALARVMAVAGLHGGTGASSLAAALARVASGLGLATTLVDLSAGGAPLDVPLGLDHDPGPRWADLAGERGSIIPERLSSALPVWSGVKVLSADERGGSALVPQSRAVLRALAQSADLVVMDLPCLGDAALAGPITTVPRTDHLLLIARTDSAGLAAVRRFAPGRGRPMSGTGRLGLVARLPAPGAVTAPELAEASGIELVATLRAQRAAAAGSERGMTPGDQRRGPLMTTARRLLTWAGVTA